MLGLDTRKDGRKMLKLLEDQLQLEEQIKSTITKGNKCFNDIINSFKNDQQQLMEIFLLLFKKIGPRILQMQQSVKLLEQTEEQMRFKKQSLYQESSQNKREQEKIQLSTEQIKQTIHRIQQAINQTIQRQKFKRQTIQIQTQISLKEIQNKICLFEKETFSFQKQNSLLTKKKSQIQGKLGRLETQFSRKALQKDQSVKKQKQELMLKLQWLEGEVSQVTELNKDYSIKQKINFDKKLSLYLKAKKFPQYSNSFQNSAKTIDQCKQQLFKGIQRMNEASNTIGRFQIEAKDLCDQFTQEFKRRDEREARIEKLKKQKQFMRDRIIFIQTKIKSMKTNLDDSY